MRFELFEMAGSSSFNYSEWKRKGVRVSLKCFRVSLINHQRRGVPSSGVELNALILGISRTQFLTQFACTGDKFGDEGPREKSAGNPILRVRILASRHGKRISYARRDTVHALSGKSFSRGNFVSLCTRSGLINARITRGFFERDDLIRGWTLETRYSRCECGILEWIDWSTDFHCV